jgi:lipopolysaccharide transport system ATP-binding protein
MSNTSIKVENLSKIYRLGEIGTGTISRDMERWFKTKVLKQEDPFLKIGETNDRANKGSSDIVYSLQDINFEIQQGDAVGIIGRNGAGKSTLLKILSRVTTPTTGRINIKGRVASLLEVGTGFHPELTGRENIYLNGAILGMRKREIDRKLDEIIDFSGVERYIDTPVKRYSSGMYVRLAFAVAAHLESEILIVDEVLAVGDAEFQKKCLGKMGEVSKGEGRTVLFVSHNLTSVRTLCNKGLLLTNGSIILNDNIENVIKQYNISNSKYIKRKFNSTNRSGVGEIFFTEIEIISKESNNVIKSGKPLEFNLEYHAESIDLKDNYEFVLGVWNINNIEMFMITNNYKNEQIKLYSKEGIVKIKIDKLPLNDGTFYANILIRKNGIVQDFIENAFQFDVEFGDYFSSGNFYPQSYEGFYTEFEMILM